MNNQKSSLLLTRRDGKVRSYEYDPRLTLIIAGLNVVALCTVLLLGGYLLGNRHVTHNQINDIRGMQVVAEMQQQVIEQARTSAQDNLDALTLRLGRMQAQLLRLDALGKRLVDVAGLETDEFDFDTEPPVGGPENASVLIDNTVPDFLTMLKELHAILWNRESKLTILEQVLMYRNVHQRVTPSGRAVEKGHLSSKFGSRIDPFTGKRELHKGIDIAGITGSEILALGDGIVTFSGTHHGYGNLVEVEHGNGITTRYAHNKTLLAGEGETVRKGQPIALMGSSGRSTGPHVHIEVLHNGNQVNPEKYLNY